MIYYSVYYNKFSLTAHFDEPFKQAVLKSDKLRQLKTWSCKVSATGRYHYQVRKSRLTQSLAKYEKKKIGLKEYVSNLKIFPGLCVYSSPLTVLV